MQSHLVPEYLTSFGAGRLSAPLSCLWGPLDGLVGRIVLDRGD